VDNNVDDMATSVQNAEHRTSRLASSYYALIVWVAAVSAAVAAVTVVTLYRRRARRRCSSSGGGTGPSTVDPPGLSSSTIIDTVERCAPGFRDVTSSVPLPSSSQVVDVTTSSASEVLRHHSTDDVSSAICDDIDVGDR